MSAGEAMARRIAVTTGLEPKTSAIYDLRERRLQRLNDNHSMAEALK
jgi:formate dehydrogenase maturation protein FdhE